MVRNNFTYFQFQLKYLNWGKRTTKTWNCYWHGWRGPDARSPQPYRVTHDAIAILEADVERNQSGKVSIRLAICNILYKLLTSGVKMCCWRHATTSVPSLVPYVMNMYINSSIMERPILHPGRRKLSLSYLLHSLLITFLTENLIEHFYMGQKLNFPG